MPGSGRVRRQKLVEGVEVAGSHQAETEGEDRRMSNGSGTRKHRA